MGRFTDDLIGIIHQGDCVDFIRSIEPHWADAILTGPSIHTRGKHRKRERRWMVNFARALKPGGVLMLYGSPGWPEKHWPTLERVGFTILGVVEVPTVNYSGKEVIIGVLCGDGAGMARLDSPWEIECSRPDWSSGVPVEECIELLKVYTSPGDLVFDPFTGMATCMVACERLGRRWIGCEMEPGRIKDAMRRIEQEREGLEAIALVSQPTGNHVTVEARLER